MEQVSGPNNREQDDSIVVDTHEPATNCYGGHDPCPQLANLQEANSQSGSTSPNTSMSGQNDQNSTTARQRYSAKLRTASRAIGLFRRAAGTLSRSLTIGQTMNKSASDLNGLPTSVGQPCEGRRPSRRRKSSTFQRFMMRHQSTGDSSQNSQNSSQNQSFGNNSHAASTVVDNQQQQLQQNFIVPRMNALKLPLKCLIRSLEGELMREVFVHRYELGQYLIENLKVSLGMNDCKYFGLRLAKSCDDQEDVKNIWLDLNESVCKQIKSKSCSALLAPPSTAANRTTTVTLNRSANAGVSSRSNSVAVASCSRTIEFYLRIKFYPPNLTRVQDSFLRNYLWLQLRRDLRLGKLTSSMTNLAQLMACILQFELGDFKPELLERLPEMQIMPNQDLVEDAAIDLWRTNLINFKRHQAQMQFLRAAIILETYGFDYYPVRDHQRQRAYLLGFNYAGIKTIRNGRIVHHFRWHSMSKISYERRMIIFHIYPTENSKRKQILGFKCMSNEDCQCLYMRLLEQKYFFTVDLTYFDKSIRRPSCLFSSPDGSSQGATDWTNNSIDDSQRQPQPQSQQETFASRPSIARASGSLEDPPTTSVSSTPECSGAYGCNDCCSPPGTYRQPEGGELVRSATVPADGPFDSEDHTTITSGQVSGAAPETWQRRAALARLHRQQSTSVSFGDDSTATRLEQANEEPQPRSAVWQQRLSDLGEHLAAGGYANRTAQAKGDNFARWMPFRVFCNTWRPLWTLASQQQCLWSVLKLLLVILVANLVLKLADNLSCALITLLTFGSASPGVQRDLESARLATLLAAQN